MPVVLGSIAGAAGAQRWFYALYAEVGDEVDIITIHYTASHPRWRGALDFYHSFGKPVWSTEELGRQAAETDLGYDRTLLVWARYVSYWLETGHRGLVFLYDAHNKGSPNGLDALEEIRERLGDRVLSVERVEDVCTFVGSKKSSITLPC